MTGLTHHADPLLVGLTGLLFGLGIMVLWRSPMLANALAAHWCLLAIGLAVHLGTILAKQGKVQLIAWAWLLAGLINSVLALAQYAGVTLEPAGTAFGFLRQRNNMASLCTLAWVALLYLSLRHRLRLKWGLPMTSCLMAALAATSSRTGFLQLILLTSLLLIALCKHKSLRLVLFCLASLASYAIAAWLLPQWIGSGESVMLRVLETTSSSANGLQLQDTRKQLWDNTWHIATQHPLWGVGWRELAYSLHMTDFGADARFGSQADNAHNLPLQLAAELGIPFAVVWLCACAGCLVGMARRTWLVQQGGLEATSLLGWAVLLVLGVHSLLEYPLWYAPFQITLGLAAGIILANTQPSTQLDWTSSTPQPLHQLRPARFSRIGGAVLLLFCTYAAFDYHRISQLFLPSADRSELYKTNAMASAEKSWLFANQVRFAKLFAAPVTAANAEQIWVLGQQVIHFSPEVRVYKALITAGELLAPDDPNIAAQVLVLKRQLSLIER
jgi:O-antigen ligase